MGLFDRTSSYKNIRGEVVERKLLKNKMEFHPPPPPTSVKGGLPSMMSFFTTPVFFWRPVGVMQAKIRCPNSNCPAPPGEFLEKKGFGSYARQVCGMTNSYTLLTEKLRCPYCEKVRRVASEPHGDTEDVGGCHEQQYIWLAHSPKILMNLAPAVRSMFPAILCGKRAVDKGVVTLLNDRVNSISMSKVQRLLQQGHDEWYVERRDLYQTLLYEAYVAGDLSSQKSILPFAKAAGTYTPPPPRTPLPCARVLRRAHMIMEMEKMPVYRASILSVTGEILCIDGTKKVLKKIYGDGQGTMQYVTSVLNQWGQFLTTVVVAAESEGCYRRMAKGLMARFDRAGAPVLESNFVAPMPYPAEYKDPDEEELLGVEYAMYQSTSFAAKDYYAQQVEKEQSCDEEKTAEQSDEEEELADEGVDMRGESEEDPMDAVSGKHAILTRSEQVEEEDSPALQDVLMTESHLQLPGLQEVEDLALLLLQLADDTDRHLVPADLRVKIASAVGALHEHDRSAANFVKQYESRWGYTLFGRCLGADTPETRAAQKTKFSWMRYPQAARVTEDSRLLYLIIKMLKNRPPACRLTSPAKITTAIKGQYKRIVDRVRDDAILNSLSIPLPNLNSKSISTFIAREEKKANFKATVIPKVKLHRRVLSDAPMPAAPTLPASLPAPSRPQVQYLSLPHVAGERHGQKQRLGEPRRNIQPKPPVATYIPPRLSAAPVLLVVPAQPQAPSMMLCGTFSGQSFG
ncbi:uncharacterized protein LOC116710776 [Xiphophorus hellerii]|uniref:uncharacterized protein LOC116710776 n=1 Tax=Xiphophorus hellerii TaxID=8084 RepID=UPI0013B40DDB|nr:uncharacterized protein LOC116710776 [Xiphophorus hellerii]